MKEQVKIFLTALMFYTRIPIPKWAGYSQEYFDRSIRYFPLIGWLVGGVAILIYLASREFLPKSGSLLLSMIGTILLTGAFHEDGFADCCDGFGAGWTKKEILDIMKDSRIGTYGAIGLILILMLKFHLLSDMMGKWIPLAFLAGHSVSRAAVMLFRQTCSYVRDGNENAKPMPQKISSKDTWIGITLGLLPLLLLPMPTIIIIIMAVLITEMIFSFWIVKKIGGYTGDCLGATQQLCEIACYIGMIISWRFI